MADGDVYKVTLEWRYATIDVAVQNVLYFRQDGAFTDPLVVPELNLGNRLAGAMPASGSWGGTFRQYLSPNFSILNVRVQRLYPIITGAYLVPVNRAGTGLVNPTFVPSSAALVVRLRSTLNTRRGHGRLYLGGFASFFTSAGVFPTMSSEGYWTADLVTAATAFITQLKNASEASVIGEAEFRFGVWSKTVAGLHAPYSNGFNEIASWEGTTAIRVQRRREVGVGI